MKYAPKFHPQLMPHIEGEEEQYLRDRKTTPRGVQFVHSKDSKQILKQNSRKCSKIFTQHDINASRRFTATQRANFQFMKLVHSR